MIFYINNTHRIEKSCYYFAQAEIHTFLMMGNNVVLRDRAYDGSDRIRVYGPTAHRFLIRSVIKLWRPESIIKNLYNVDYNRH